MNINVYQTSMLQIHTSQPIQVVQLQKQLNTIL